MNRSACLAVVLTLLTPSVPASSNPKLADYLAGRELLVEGTALTTVTGRYLSSGSCSGSPATRSRDVTIRVRKVIAGVAPDSVVTIRCGPLAGEPPASGAHVLGYAFRDECDGWKLHGSVFTIASDGRLGHPTAQYGPASWPELKGELEERRDRISDSPFRQFDSACLVRVNEIEPTGPESFPRFHTQAVRSFLGESGFPHELAFVPLPGTVCSSVEVGDTLLVPVRTGDGPVVAFSCCPSAMVVKNGFLAFFGVPLTSFQSRVVLRGEAGFHLREILAADPR